MTIKHTTRDTIHSLLLYLTTFLVSILYTSFMVSSISSTREVGDQKEVEYYLELVEQDSVIVRNADTDRVYKVHIDSIQAVLEQDNL